MTKTVSYSFEIKEYSDYTTNSRVGKIRGTLKIEEDEETI